MLKMVQADLVKLAHRRALAISLVAIPLLIGIGVIVIFATQSDPQPGEDYQNGGAVAVGIITQIVCVIVAARMGSEEHTAGTIRYQVLTGVGRSKLYASKLIALGLVCVVASFVGWLTLVVGKNLVDLVGEVDLMVPFWRIVLGVLVYSAIAFGIGGLLRSTGPAIGISIFLALGASNIVLVLLLIDDSLAWVSVDVALERITVDDADPEDRIQLGAAFASLIFWTGMPLVAGLARLRRLEL